MFTHRNQALFIWLFQRCNLNLADKSFI